MASSLSSAELNYVAPETHPVEHPVVELRDLVPFQAEVVEGCIAEGAVLH